MRIVNVMVGGPAQEIPEALVLARQAEPWVGVDYGATYLLERGIVPLMALGDFDSTQPAKLAALQAQVPTVRFYPPEKDYTDTQIGVKAALEELKADQINLFGATGGRLDQLLANLYFPLMAEFQPCLEKLVIIDRQNEVRYFRPGFHTLHQLPGMKYLAFVNLTPVTGLTLPDEKYRLTDYDAPIPISWSSNEFAGPVNHFSFKSGVVAVIQSKDSPATARR
ncbi:thiamine diphosphokinase [Limosilactobacillus ingluviei]|uniref:Thiamine diphosphokinase n=1 Tax=Limosilactobacillus ingluviei TaxID=148604 RepID=A0A0R2GX42_9LACO|nr:thiamine diphosphokinase [Limosilactobacillus ingluviei]KRN45377.1 hypothetical protein IV41_GL001118 [Limosilactobacillus ingluviei]